MYRDEMAILVCRCVGWSGLTKAPSREVSSPSTKQVVGGGSFGSSFSHLPECSSTKMTTLSCRARADSSCFLDAPSTTTSYSAAAAETWDRGEGEGGSGLCQRGQVEARCRTHKVGLTLLPASRDEGQRAYLVRELTRDAMRYNGRIGRESNEMARNQEKRNRQGLGLHGVDRALCVQFRCKTNHLGTLTLPVILLSLLL